MADDATFITRANPGSGRGPVLAVKDLIDVAGLPTTAGSRVVADVARRAGADAACLAGARAQDAQIIGKTNLVELALGVSGINPWFGTPVNPLDPSRIPGGSSSGSAVVVATGEAEVAYGSDTGGSIRLPAACCGVVGLKTSFGRISLEGVWPLAPSLDSVGPMALTVAGIELGMQLLEPGFVASQNPPTRVGRLRLPAAPFIDADIDEALRASGIEVVEVAIANWNEVWLAALDVIEHEAARSNRALLGRLSQIDPAVATRLQRGASLSPVAMASARETGRAWTTQLGSLLAEHGLLVVPTLSDTPPLISEATGFRTMNLSPVNLAGVPAISLPVGNAAPVPASMQVIGAMGSEEQLVGFGRMIESAAGFRAVTSAP